MYRHQNKRRGRGRRTRNTGGQECVWGRGNWQGATHVGRASHTCREGRARNRCRLGTTEQATKQHGLVALLLPSLPVCLLLLRALLFQATVLRMARGSVRVEVDATAHTHTRERMRERCHPLHIHHVLWHTTATTTDLLLLLLQALLFKSLLLALCILALLLQPLLLLMGATATAATGARAGVQRVGCSSQPHAPRPSF